MASRQLAPRVVEADESPLEAFLRRSVIYEKAGAFIPRDLLNFGLYGSAIVTVTGLLALLFPSPDSIRHSGFFLVLGASAANLEAIMHSLAIPAICCGLALLALDLYLTQGRRSEHWRTAVVAQAAAGGVGGILSIIFLALMLLNLVIWILIVAAGVACLCLLLAGAGS
jgi:hypothetical protein